MRELESEEYIAFREAIEGLEAGDFSRLAPLFDSDQTPDDQRCRIIDWYEQGLFADEPKALAEALTCACFLGRTVVADYLLSAGGDPSAGANTGLNAFHWAANRGQLDVVKLLIVRKTPLETRSMYGGTVLGTAVWAAIHEPKPDHLRIIEVLIEAGARLDDAGYPTGDERIDKMLQKFSL